MSEEDNEARHLMCVQIKSTIGDLDFKVRLTTDERDDSELAKAAAIKMVARMLANPNSATFTVTHLGSSALKKSKRSKKDE
jgi:hypothetical protein